MDMKSQRQSFLKIIRTSLINILGFGAVAFAIIYLASLIQIPIIFKVLALADTLVTLISISGLLVFMFYTFKTMPETLQAKPPDISFAQIYGYTIAALILRCIEGILCIYFLVRIFNAVMFV